MANYTTQGDVDAAFVDLDALLAEREAPPLRLGTCEQCGGTHLARVGNSGSNVEYYSCCNHCGAVQSSGYGKSASDYWVRRSSSNYRRIHHWHERISQLCLLESPIPDEHLLQIAERLLDGTHAVIDKCVIRGVLRSLNMQLYIEKWLSIVWRITGIMPPRPGPVLLMQLDSMFQELQQPFAAQRPEGRKNFLNYNYVLCRLFQKLKCPQFSMFFPTIKSKQKLAILDDTWNAMVSSVGWEATPFMQVAPFAVRLEEPAALLATLREKAAAAALVERPEAPVKTGFRKSDLRLLHELGRQRELATRRSNPPAPELQRPAAGAKRPRKGQGGGPQSKPRLLPRRRLG